MAILVFQHHPDETPFQLATTLQSYGYKLRTVKLFAADATPAPRSPS